MVGGVGRAGGGGGEIKVLEVYVEWKMGVGWKGRMVSERTG